VATPIGNLGDLTPRAADTLRRADLVLAEDKRVSAKLLSHAGAKTRLSNYNDHTSEAERDAIVARLGSEAIALVSDAGTPLISDPGYKLVRAARAEGHDVHTLPGPSAAIAALTLAGLPTDRFLFAGFLPSKAKARTDAIGEFSGIRATLVFYESGPRLEDTLAALHDALGNRDAAVIREISKLHEETVAGSPSEQAEASDEDVDRAIDNALKAHSPSRAAAEVAAALNIPKKRAYARALERSK